MKRDTDVLVVGAGPVGLALAIELGMRGVRVLLAERNIRGGSAPRAKTTNVRTRTHLRRWGIADKLAQSSPLGVDYPNDIRFVTRLAGHPLTVFRDAFNAAPIRSPYYPEHAQWVPQYTLERVMLDLARALPSVEIRFDATFISATQDGQTVSSSLRTGADESLAVTSRFLVGADGSRSTVRELIGAKMEGRYGLTRSYNIIFRAPGLAEAHAQGPAVMYWQINRDGLSVVGQMDRNDVWFFMPAGLKPGEALSDEAAAKAIRTATGIDLPYEILSADEWVASELLADRYRDGHVFLAGDACHLHPPFGGYGMNMGVGDSVDLGWKLAALIQGWGGPALLDSYEQERRPVHRLVIDEAVANLQDHAGGKLYAEGLEDDTPKGEASRREVGERIQAAKAREFHTLGTVLGLSYENSPLITPDGSPPSRSGGQFYEPSAHPGSLAPHAWLPDGRSLYDLFGNGFALIVADGADESEVLGAEDDARNLGVPLKIVRAPGAPIRKLYQVDYTLVRPDQHVSWRGPRWARSVLQRAIGAVRAGSTS